VREARHALRAALEGILAVRPETGDQICSTRDESDLAWTFVWLNNSQRGHNILYGSFMQPDA
jgi:hypothetical protein